MEINRERVKEQDKKYRNNNKEKIRERKKEKFSCCCGSTLRKSDRCDHEKTKKHLKYLESLIAEI